MNTPRAPAQGLFINENAIDQHGKRVSAFTAFLNKILANQRKDHLTVCTNTIVTKLEINELQDAVDGVFIRKDGDDSGSPDLLVTARREVILCNGALATPQLLMLSGIGSKEELSRHGIPQISELPVGNYLQDHTAFAIVLEVTSSETVFVIQKILAGLWNLLLYMVTGKGILGSGLTPRSIFVRTTVMDDKCVVQKVDNGKDSMDSKDPCNVPDVEVMFIACPVIDCLLPEYSLISLLTALVQPVSRGSLQLASIKPHDHPLVHYPYFTDQKDIITARTAARFSMRLATEFLENGDYPHRASLFMTPTINKERVPKRSSQSGEVSPKMEYLLDATTQTIIPRNKTEKTWDTVTDEEIDAYVNAVGMTAFHFASTCRMSLDPKSGVVGQSLRVHGFKNLRIADASAFPKVPPAHTMLLVMMLAARCAAFIKMDREHKNF